MRKSKSKTIDNNKNNVVKSDMQQFISTEDSKSSYKKSSGYDITKEDSEFSSKKLESSTKKNYKVQLSAKKDFIKEQGARVFLVYI